MNPWIWMVVLVDFVMVATFIKLMLAPGPWAGGVNAALLAEETVDLIIRRLHENDKGASDGSELVGAEWHAWFQRIRRRRDERSND